MMTTRGKAKTISSAGVRAAKQRRAPQDNGPVQLSTGVWVLVRPVSANLIADAQAGIKDPPVPKVPNPDKDNRLEENPSDPIYLEQLAEANAERVLAGLDVMIAMGVVLVDEQGNPVGLPQDAHWLKTLKILEKHNRLDLSHFDFDDPDDLEFLYKKYVAVSAADIQVISRATGLTQEDVERATATFRDNQK